MKITIIIFIIFSIYISYSNEIEEEVIVIDPLDYFIFNQDTSSQVIYKFRYYNAIYPDINWKRSEFQKKFKFKFLKNDTVLRERINRNHKEEYIDKYFFRNDSLFLKSTVTYIDTKLEDSRLIIPDKVVNEKEYSIVNHYNKNEELKVDSSLIKFNFRFIEDTVINDIKNSFLILDYTSVVFLKSVNNDSLELDKNHPLTKLPLVNIPPKHVFFTRIIFAKHIGIIREYRGAFGPEEGYFLIEVITPENHYIIDKKENKLVLKQGFFKRLFNNIGNMFN